jgi:hypothetical protein
MTGADQDYSRDERGTNREMFKVSVWRTGGVMVAENAQLFPWLA